MTAEVVPPSAYKDWNSFIQKPVGSGAFKFVEFRPNDRVVLEANSDYFGGRPKIDQLIIRYIPDAATRAAALKAGEVQTASGLPIDAAKDITASGNTALPLLLTRGLSIDFNEQMADHPLNKDVRVRQGLNYAIDKESINKDFLLGFGALMDAQIPQKGTFGYNPELKPYPYDPEKAKSLFAEAGFPNGFEMEIQTQPVFGHQDIATIAVCAVGQGGSQEQGHGHGSGRVCQCQAGDQARPSLHLDVGLFRRRQPEPGVGSLRPAPLVSTTFTPNGTT